MKSRTKWFSVDVTVTDSSNNEVYKCHCPQYAINAKTAIKKAEKQVDNFLKATKHGLTLKGELSW